jgi:hypothetical protein
MLQQLDKKGTKKRQIRFPGICQDAKALGVHRISLYRTLTGEWKLPGLLGRYRSLKQQQST